MIHPELQRVRDFLCKIPKIHKGGCAIAALAMYKVATNLGISIALAYLYDGCYIQEYFDNCGILQGKNNRARGCTHAMVVINGVYMDCDDTTDGQDYTYIHIVSEDLVVKSLLENEWNPVFKRDHYLPEIEQFLGFKLIV